MTIKGNRLNMTILLFIEGLTYWLGTAGVFYMTANNIVKNGTRDVITFLERKDRR